ncbi:MAG TPA: hypothetical protein VNK96_01210 [Fimbriimonadales bacterium]|nr:hypothetical protein [Fimbriimonadales bacterium]
MKGETEQRLIHRLLEVSADIRKRGLIPADGPPEAQELVETNPYAFLLAGCLDRGTKAELIWGIPYQLQRQLGHLDPCRIAEMSEAELKEVIKRLEKKPRYTNDAPRTIKELSAMVCNDLGGRVQSLWENRSAKFVQERLQQIHGVGPGIAAMIVILLERLDLAHFHDTYNINVKPDVHVQRVLYRLGLSEQMSEKAAIETARRLSPGYPGELDSPLWWIGTKWCFSSQPNCGGCPVSDICSKRI